MTGIYSESEMVARYNAWEMDYEKDQYITVLADLNATTRKEIKDMLEQHGCRIPKPARKSRTYADWELEIIVDMVEAQCSAGDIAKELGRSPSAIRQKINLMGLSVRYSYWTEETVSELIRLRNLGYKNREIAEILNAPLTSVNSKASEICAKRGHRWTSDEVDTLKAMRRDKHSGQEIAEKIGCPRSVVYAKIHDMRRKGEL